MRTRPTTHLAWPSRAFVMMTLTFKPPAAAGPNTALISSTSGPPDSKHLPYRIQTSGESHVRSPNRDLRAHFRQVESQI